jgi:O-antigen ligase
VSRALSPGRLVLLALGALANAALAAALVEESRGAAIGIAVLPVGLVVFGALVASNRAILVFTALALDFAYPLPIDRPLPLPGGTNVYLPDLLVALAVVAWAVSWLLAEPDARPSWLRTPVLGWPFTAFSLLMIIAIVRGHARYGESLLSVPLRLVAYAGIAAALTTITAREAYHGIVFVFYAGAVWQAGVGIYELATGGSVTGPGQLSTGGERLLAGSVAVFLSGSLLLALLNVERETRAKRQALHLAVAAVATFSLILTFQRTTFAAIGVVVPLLFLFVRRLTTSVAWYLPLCVPFVVVAVLLIPRVVPTLGPTLTHRLTASPSSDTSARWRQHAIHAVFAQVRESPITGVGFGREASFSLNGVRVTLTQDPHDQFIYLWAGGGLLLLGSFVVLLLTYLRDSWRRARRATGLARMLVIWAMALWFVFIVNVATGVILTAEYLLLPFWIVMLLPAALVPLSAPSAEGGAADAAAV